MMVQYLWQKNLNVKGYCTVICIKIDDRETCLKTGGNSAKTYTLALRQIFASPATANGIP